MAPVIRELSKDIDRFDPRICVTVQHREMLDQVLEVLDIKPDIDLDLVKENRTLSGLTSGVVTAISEALNEENPE